MDATNLRGYRQPVDLSTPRVRSAGRAHASELLSRQGLEGTGGVAGTVAHPLAIGTNEVKQTTQQARRFRS
jgi:hypothetical protein